MCDKSSTNATSDIETLRNRSQQNDHIDSMARTGLLVVTNLSKIVNSLSAVKKYVSNTLYIQLYTGPTGAPNAVASESNSFVGALKPLSANCKYAVDIYSASLRLCDQLDVILIVGNLRDANKWQTIPVAVKQPVDVLLFDKGISNDETTKLMHHYNTKNVIEFSSNDLDETTNVDVASTGQTSKQSNERYDKDAAIEGDAVILGGTFDRLHIGHKIMLTEAVLRAHKSVYVGVTDESLVQTKLLRELILPLETRINDVREFLTSIDNSLTYHIVPINNMFGPTITEQNLDVIVVSAETARGGAKVNEVRREKGWHELKTRVINLIELDESHEAKENKVSSSNQRLDLLGTRLKQPIAKPHLPNYPYIIGLIGGIASGKSVISQHFEKLGAAVINCDKLAHQIYEPGTVCHAKLIEHFGGDIQQEDGLINRKRLGAIVFADKQKLNELNRIVWPSLMVEVQRRIEQIRNDKSHDVVMIEAAVLLQAGWEKEMHEVWSLIVPAERAIKRLISRDNLSEEQAKQRIDAQPSNETMVAASTVVFSTQWSYAFSQQQADKAWKGLQEYLKTLKS